MRENLLRNGDYVPDGFGGFVRAQGDEKMLARALFKLSCHRGAFVFLPELGSRLSELGKEKCSAMETAARQYCVQALEGVEAPRIGILIGPEGGISEKEAAWLRDEAGGKLVTLGPRILRTETAGLCALTMVMAYRGELE
ncbi:MAG: RsmE family RNA methyltransferase [Oscillospiraceae bacterium]|nr:RsmE family RNA methyltransferase [Oscillospiraceae bacterium]